jgi:phage terminase large subunit
MPLDQNRVKIDYPEVFTPLLGSARFKGAHGGRGSGKSWQYALMVVLRMMGAEARIVCLREVQKSIKDSVKQLIEDIIEHHGWLELFEFTEQEIRGPHGSVCIFRGLQNHTAASIKSLEGFDVAWVEEAQTITQRSLDLLTPTIRAEGSELWFSWNPTSRLDPIDKMLRRYPPDDSIIIEANWRDNPWFPDSLKGDMARDREQDPEKAAHIWDGEYASVTGGAYYAALIADSRRAGRITSVEHDKDLPVYVAWDLGIGDSMVLLLWQQQGSQIRVIDHYENHSQPLPHYVKWLEAKPYEYADDWVPHDAKVRELGTGRTRVETLKSLGRKPRVVPNHKIDDGINALREVLPRMWFDAEKCEYALECLMQYREDFDEKLLTLKSRPLHDWTSHTADSARYCAMAYREMKAPDPEPGPAKFDMSLTAPPTLDEMWREHEKSENGKNW